MKFVDLDLRNGRSIINLVNNYRSDKRLYNMIIRMFDDNRDIDGFLEIFNVSTGKPISREYFEWKYLKNPFRSNIHPIHVVEENERLIGVYCVIFGRMMVKGTMVYTTQGTDAIVHPDFRGQGIYSEQIKFCQELYRGSEYKFIYGFPNKLSIGSNFRIGYKPTYEIIRHWKVLNFREVFKKVFHNPILKKAGSLLSPLLYYKTMIPQVGNQNVAVKEVRDVKILEEVYNRWKKPDKIYTVRDETYLNWRFKSHPEIDYQFLAAYVGQEVDGYFVISMTDFKGMKIGAIVDYLVVDDDPKIFEPLLNYSLNIFKNDDCALAVTWVFTQKWSQPVVEDYGFISSQNAILRCWLSKTHLLAGTLNERNFPYDLASIEWYITPGDSDTY